MSKKEKENKKVLTDELAKDKYTKTKKNIRNRSCDNINKSKELQVKKDRFKEISTQNSVI